LLCRVVTDVAVTTLHDGYCRAQCLFGQWWGQCGPGCECRHETRRLRSQRQLAADSERALAARAVVHHPFAIRVDVFGCEERLNARHQRDLCAALVRKDVITAKEARASVRPELNLGPLFD